MKVVKFAPLSQVVHQISQVHQKWQIVQEVLLSFTIPDIFLCLQIFFWTFYMTHTHTHTVTLNIHSAAFSQHLYNVPDLCASPRNITPRENWFRCKDTHSRRWVIGVNGQTWRQNFAFGSVTHCKTEQGWDEKQRGAKGLHWFLQTFLFSFLLPFDFFFRSLLFFFLFFYCTLPFLPLHFFVFSPSSFLRVCLTNSVLHCGSCEPLGQQPSDCLFTTSPRGLSVWRVYRRCSGEKYLYSINYF